MLKSDEIILKIRFGVPDKTVICYEGITVDQDKVFEMLKKSVPTKPHILDQWVCPNCKTRFMTYSLNKHCSECGQKLDWEETK